MPSDVVVVDVLGAGRISYGTKNVSGDALGGRRARIALVAVAVAAAPVLPDVLAAQIWGDRPPPTWQVALRGLMRSIRAACAELELAEWLIQRTPTGFRLRPDAVVSTAQSARRLEIAERLLTEERYAAARAESEPLTSVDGSLLLPGEDLDWLGPHRRALDDIRLRALFVSARAGLGQSDADSAVTVAREAAEVAPLDERTHRLLIESLAAAGDRAGVVAAYDECRSLLADQLGVHPSPQTEDVYLVALRDHGGLASRARLPTETTTFHGRDRDVAAVVRSLAAPGVVSVVGAGGVGKSRLGVHAAARSGHFDGGRHWVHLANLRDDDLVASTVAVALGALVGANDPADAVADLLAPLGRALIVLDGCELVADGVRTLVGALRERCPQLTVLLTSRIPLSITDERLHAVQPFPTPVVSTGAPDANGPAIAILADRVHGHGGQIVIDDATAPLLAELCRRCGGLPLALELAAAQLARMPVGDLLDELDDTGDDQLRGILRQSYALLDEREAAVFRRLSALGGAAGLALIRRVVSDGDVPAVRVVRLLRELVAHGLVSVDTSGPRWLYELDDDVVKFAAELLTEAGEATDVFGRLATAIREMLPADPGSSPDSYAKKISEIAPALRSLLGACRDGTFDISVGLEIVFRLHRYWPVTDVGEGRLWSTRLLEGNADLPAAGPAMFAAGYLGYWSGDTDAAITYLRRAAARIDDVDTIYRVRALNFLAGLTDDADRAAEALEYIHQADAAAVELGAAVQMSTAMGIACLLSERCNPRARGWASRAVSLCESAGLDALGPATATAAVVCWQIGELDSARAYVEKARPMLADQRRPARVAMLTAAAAIALYDGDLAAAVDHARAAEDEATALGVQREVPLIRSLLARGLLGSSDVDAAARACADAIRACRVLGYWHPLSVCLETAAMVLAAAGRRDVTGPLLTHAAALRARGDRPAPTALPAPRAPQSVPGSVDLLDHERMARRALVHLEEPRSASVAQAADVQVDAP